MYLVSIDFLGEREMQWEHEPQTCVFIAFSSCPNGKCMLLSKLQNFQTLRYSDTQAQIKRKVDNATQQINRYPVDKCYLLDSDLSS